MHLRPVLVFACAACGSGATSTPVDSGTTAPVYAGEILHDGDFEELDGTGWLTSWQNYDSNPDGAIVVVTDPHVYGSHALQWQIDTAGDGREYWVTQHAISPSLLVPGHVYELTGSYRTDHAGEVAFNYILRGEPGDAPDLSTVSLPAMHPYAPNVWEAFTYEITIPAGAAPASWDFSLHSIKFTGEPEALTVDGVSLHPKP